ncbi:related to cation diffusion facilitator 10 [Fusarium torulosum]|uniref:Related to cation diffusion facilitator 10 n=1 Tax=Fusarium torulosum TaxID=33205 RepID=A0AAE8SJH4_9HYPO|nr:related to cation diffusion facilitator 10 [Fusarium torulosum]
MSSPSTPSKHGSHAQLRRPSFLSNDDSHNPLGTRSGHLQSLIRNRSAQSVHSLSSSLPTHSGPFWMGPDDEETALIRHDNDELGRLLADERRLTQLLHGPQNRSAGLIGRSNPRYRWEQYWKPEEELSAMPKPLREYYERTNDLIQQYLYIDALLDSAIPHDLLNEYQAELDSSAFRPVDVPDTITEEPTSTTETSPLNGSTPASFTPGSYGAVSVKLNNSSTKLPATRTPQDIFRSSENLPLLQRQDHSEGEDDEPPSVAASQGDDNGPRPLLPWLEDAEIDSDDPIVTLAIWVNFIANGILLAGKLAVIVSVPSMSVLASLVDAVLDFLSTIIVWITTRLISSSHHDQYSYPVGRRKLEPLGVLVFSIIMITSFVQVGLECIQRLMDPEHPILELGIPAIAIMVSTIVIKGACWIWCRVVKNSSVRALAEDAKTDVIFNTGSILFPIIGFYARIWWLDAFGGLFLSMVVIFNWSQTSAHHVRNLSGFSAQPDERNLLLYLTMRFATAIRQIQNLRAYHAGDKLFVEVDIVLSAATPLKDSHDLSEVLTYFLESVPIVDRAFVHVDYTSYNAPTHMLKGSSAKPK